MLEYTLGGRNISEVLSMPVAEAEDFFADGEARTPAAHKILDDDSAGACGTYVVRGSSSFAIDEGVEAIATLFEQPRTCNDVAAVLREATGADAIAPFLEELARAGIIVRSESARLAEA